MAERVAVHVGIDFDIPKQPTRMSWDIDGILLTTHDQVWVDYSNEQGWTDRETFTVANYDDNWMRTWVVPQKEAEHRARQYARSGALEAAKPDPAAQESVGLLSEIYPEMAAITGRRVIQAAQTAHWLDLHFDGAIQHLYLPGTYEAGVQSHGRVTKKEVVKRARVERYVDDEVHQANAAIAGGARQVYLFTTTRNKEDCSVDPRIIRVGSHTELVQHAAAA